MNKFHFRTSGMSPGTKPPCQSDDKIQYLLSEEENLLQSISAGAPLPGVLNGICSSLDCQIGNVVSLISLPGEDPGELAAIAMNAALFGLYAYCSEGIVAENGERIGSLEMYCSFPRGPSAGESQLIERAKCLAAIAIKRNQKAPRQDPRQDHCGVRRNRTVQGHVLETPVSMN